MTTVTMVSPLYRRTSDLSDAAVTGHSPRAVASLVDSSRYGDSGAPDAAASPTFRACGDRGLRVPVTVVEPAPAVMCRARNYRQGDTPTVSPRRSSCATNDDARRYRPLKPPPVRRSYLDRSKPPLQKIPIK